MLQLSYQPEASHYVGGGYLEDASGVSFDCLNPATGDVIARLYNASPQIVERAVACARDAQAIWAATPPAERGRVLRRVADLIRERNEELSVLETLNTGKPISETREADAASGADCLEYFGCHAATLTADHIPLGGDWAYTQREPLGVCLGIGAWNYPIQIACWKAAPALACGNAMIFKPSELTPLTALKLAEILTEAGAPAGLFNVVQGMRETGAALTEHPGIAKVSLTGSVPTGRAVAAAAAGQMKHITMELGGKSPLIIFDDADIDSAVSGAILGNFYSTGQICSNATRVFVHANIKETFLARLAERTAKIKIGDPMMDDTQIGPLVSEAQAEKVQSYIAKAEQEGATRITPALPLPEGATWVSPVVFADVTDEMTIAREEIFGPVMSVLEFQTEEEVIARANSTEFGLAAGVFTSDLARGHRVVSQLKAGTCWINAYNLTPVEMPFGGVGQSGIGRENARAAIEHYSQLKSVYVSMSRFENSY
ncbi:NAD/NADP-dependent betaine aldehyde dehydrogenase [Roseovarius albus]|uniref:Betaine aldehyde dehydrogenase n=1 Tax=Roseovarius albus TaxID=1247867 RepID=A0A1X7A3L7_9RHOB|nr:betaine-aldehyde dehydrogenase [Roseovarius albus]SLN69660.1 NAD/NADP-dependent betaine aldehyde dehydrogenase [Roseovarius albus]